MGRLRVTVASMPTDFDAAQKLTARSVRPDGCLCGFRAVLVRTVGTVTSMRPRLHDARRSLPRWSW